MPVENLLCGSQNYLFYMFRESELPFCVSQNYLFVKLTFKIAFSSNIPVLISINGSSDLHIISISETFLEGFKHIPVKSIV